MGELGVAANQYEVSFWGDERLYNSRKVILNILKSLNYNTSKG